MTAQQNSPDGAVVPVNGYDEEVDWLRAAGSIEQDQEKEAE